MCTVGIKFHVRNAYSLTEKRVILICLCGRDKSGEKQNIDPMWKVLMKDWQTKQRNNDTKSQHHVLMTINSTKKRKVLWDNYLQFARRLF